MKTFFLISALACLTLSAVAQTPKTVVNCYVTGGRVDYGHLAQLLPDSIKTTLLVDVHKLLNTYYNDLVLLWLQNHGWKLSVGNPNPSDPYYVLTKEIDLDDSARTLFLQKLENLNKK
jgi:hypothetical protein